MAATFGEPSTLSNHEVSHKKSTEVSPVLASASEGSKTQYATLGINGEGINIIDLTTLKPEVARLLGPEARFACPPVSRVSGARRDTFAVLDYPKASSSKKVRRGLSSWTSSESLASLDEKGSIMLDENVTALYAPRSLSNNIVLVSSDASVMLYNDLLEELYREDEATNSTTLLFSFLFDPAECSFTPRKTAATLVLVTRRLDSIYTQIYTIDQKIEKIGDLQVLVEAPEIVSASCDKSGILSFFDRKCVLSTFELDNHQGQPRISLVESITLNNLYPSGISAMAAGSSHVIIAGATKSSSDIVILLWDMRYGTLIAEGRIAIPKAMSSLAAELLHLRLVSVDQSQSLIVITTDHSHKRQIDTQKATILVVPHSIPNTSSLANAMGRAEVSKAWLTQSQDDGDGLKIIYDDDREEMLSKVATAIYESQLERADEVFFEWERTQRALLKGRAKGEAKKQMAALAPKKLVNGANEDEEMATGNPKEEPKIIIKHIPDQIEWGYSFLKRLMDLVLGTPLPKNVEAPFFTQIPFYFLERNLISDGIVDGGVVKILLERGDWKSIRRALVFTIDISEDQLMALLLHSVRLEQARPKQRRKRKDAMEVDQPNGHKERPPFPLPLVLGLIMAYPTSLPSLRVAMKHHFSKVDDVLMLLKIVNGWVHNSAHKSLDFRLGDVEKELKTNEGLNQGKRVGDDGLPRFDFLIQFVSCLLDVALLDLVQFRDAHQTLELLAERLAPWSPYLDSLERLRGPLEAFARTDRLQRTARDDKKRTRLKAERKEDNHALTIDLYSVEEFVV